MQQLHKHSCNLVEAHRSTHCVVRVFSPAAEHIDHHCWLKQCANVVINLGVAAAAVRHHEELYRKH